MKKDENKNIINIIKDDEKLKSNFIYLIACALQKYDEEVYDECEGHYTSFADKFIENM